MIHGDNPHDALVKNAHIAVDDWAERAARDRQFHIIDQEGHQHDYTISVNQEHDEGNIDLVAMKVRVWRKRVFGVVRTLAELRDKGVQFDFKEQLLWFKESEQTGKWRLRALPKQVISVVDTQGQVYYIPRVTAFGDVSVLTYNQWLRTFRLVVSSLFPKGTWEEAMNELYAHRKAEKALQNDFDESEIWDIAVSDNAALHSSDWDFSEVPDGNISLTFPVTPRPYISHEQLVEADDEDSVFAKQTQTVHLDPHDWDYADVLVPLTFQSGPRPQDAPDDKIACHPMSKKPAKEGGLSARNRTWTIHQDLQYNATVEADTEAVLVSNDTVLATFDYDFADTDIPTEFSVTGVNGLTGGQ